jgi:hypothetical protein
VDTHIYTIKVKVFFITAFIFIFACKCIFASASLSSISAKGKAIYETKKQSYPDFENGKYDKEAEERYPLVKIGDQITINTKRNSYTGKFGGMKGSLIIVGDKTLPTIDISEEELLRYSADKNQKARNAYVKKFSDEYNSKKLEFIDNLKEEIFFQYPALDEKKLLSLFHKIGDKEKRKTYIDAYRNSYEEALPITESLAETEKNLLTKFTEKFQELCISEGYFWLKEEKKITDKKYSEASKRKFQRLQERTLSPKTCSPSFEPDGGIFESGKEVKIICSSENAIIYYTLDGSEPNELSTKYEAPIILDKPLEIKAIAHHPEFNDSDISISAPWAGGVYASYFEHMTFQGLTKERNEMEIDFKSNGKSPIEGIPPHCFSVIWVGQIIPDRTGDYEIFLTPDDGARMWLGDILFIDAWKEQSPTEYSKKIKLEAGKKYDFKIAFTEVNGYASCKLEWQSESVPRQIIPQERLFPGGKYLNALKTWNKKTVQGNQENYINRQGMKNPGEYGGNYKLPVRGGQSRWDKLGIK